METAAPRKRTIQRTPSGASFVVIDGIQVEVGDFVRVLPTPGKHDSFIGRVMHLGVQEGVVTYLDIWGGKRGYEKNRSLVLDRLAPLSAKMQQKLKREEP